MTQFLKSSINYTPHTHTYTYIYIYSLLPKRTILGIKLSDKIVWQLNKGLTLLRSWRRDARSLLQYVRNFLLPCMTSYCQTLYYFRIKSLKGHVLQKKIKDEWRVRGLSPFTLCCTSALPDDGWCGQQKRTVVSNGNQVHKMYIVLFIGD